MRNDRRLTRLEHRAGYNGELGDICADTLIRAEFTAAERAQAAREVEEFETSLLGKESGNHGTT